MAHLAYRLLNITIRNFKINRVFMCTFPRENLTPAIKDFNLPKDDKNTNLLLLEIENADSCHKLLKITSRHSQVYDKDHILKTMELFFTFASNDSKLSQMITNHSAFDGICSTIKKHCRTMTTNEIINVLKVLTLLEIPGNSTIFQILLQLIRQNINHLDLNHIMFLNTILTKSSESHLGNALKLALPLVFQLQVGMQIDHENIPHLLRTLKFATQNEIPRNSLNKIITCLLLQSKNINHDSAATILNHLSYLEITKEDANIIKLLHHTFNVLTNEIDKSSYEIIIRLLNRIKECIINKNHDIFYKPDFLNVCCNFAIKNDIGFQNAFQIFKTISRIDHCNFELLEYVSDTLVKNPIMLSKPFFLISYIEFLSKFNYKPKSWEIICSHLENIEIMDINNVNVPYLKFAHDLAILDIYHDGFLKRLLDEKYLNEYLTKHYKPFNLIILLSLNQAITTFRPSLLDITIPKFYLDRAIDLHSERKIDDIFQYYLILALGGPQYIASNVLMPNGIFVDFVIGYREGQYPVALHDNQNKNQTLFKELPVESCSHIVCLFGHQNIFYSRNNEILKGRYVLRKRILERLGFKVVNISLVQWKSMPDVEKIPYLMREINFSVQSDSNINKKYDI